MAEFMYFFDYRNFDRNLYFENYLKVYKAFNNIWKKLHILNYKEITNLNSLETKCYFGSGSYPMFIDSWEIKTSALLYDTFLFDLNVFPSMVIGFVPPKLDDECEIKKLVELFPPLDLNASRFLIDLYMAGYVKLVSQRNIWNTTFNSNVYNELKKENKLYTDETEIDEVCNTIAMTDLVPKNKSTYENLLFIMNKDILTSYITGSSIITKEYSYYIKRKLKDFDQIKSKYNIVNSLLEYEVPNFDSLDYYRISKLRKLQSLSKLREKIEESSQNLIDDNSNIEEVVQNYRDELWKLALDNIEDRQSNVIIESLISNIPFLSSLFSARDLLKVKKLQNHWGYTILQLKK